MCRLLFVSGTKDNIDSASFLIDALVKASLNDPTYGNEVISHKDGFGYVLYGLGNGKITNIYFRSTKPIFESDKDIVSLKNTLKGFDRFAFAIHVRLASAGSKDTVNIHPYMFSLPNGINFFFMHNGTLCKDKVEEKFKVKVDDNLSDSFTFSYAISRKLENFLKAKEFLKSGKDFVKENSGFNTISFFADGNNVDSIITVFFKGKKDYYKAYFLENQGLIAFMSSTLKLHLEKDTQDKLEEISTGTMLTIQDILGDTKISRESF
ncbi:MAG: class II glutamine amidotransferase [Caldisericum sp.]|nr:class II glutamine amidotransferase [Caldisericum sp.]